LPGPGAEPHAWLDAVEGVREHGRPSGPLAEPPEYGSSRPTQASSVSARTPPGGTAAVTAGRGALTLELSANALKHLQAAVKAKRTATLKLILAAVDAAGNERTRTGTLALKR
jgi:hypothetical protein